MTKSGLNKSKPKDLLNVNIQYIHPFVCFQGYMYSKQHTNNKNTLFAKLNNIPNGMNWYCCSYEYIIGS